MRKQFVNSGEIMARAKGIYAVYRDDELLAMGTCEECAEILGVTLKTMRCYTSALNRESRHKHHRKYRMEVIKIGDVNDDEMSEM